MKALAPALFLAMLATPALAVPACYVPRGGEVIISIEIGKMSETEKATFYEQQLRMRGIEASQTRFWNGCVQTFVTENGKFTMKFFDPWTLAEVPAN